MGIALSFPCGDLVDEDFLIGDAAVEIGDAAVETLRRENGEFGLGHIERHSRGFSLNLYSSGPGLQRLKELVERIRYEGWRSTMCTLRPGERRSTVPVKWGIWSLSK